MATTGHTPVACALTGADLAKQAARWLRLAAVTMTGRTETADGFRVSFRHEAGVEDELQKLVAVEKECCPWAAWTVHRSAGDVVLEVRSAGEGIAALHSMFTALRQAREPTAPDQSPPPRLTSRPHGLPK